MSKNEYKEKLKEFNAALNRITNTENMSMVRKLVEFYFFFTDANKTKNYQPPFSRHVAVAKKILVWSQNDPDKAFGLVYDCWLYFSGKGLNWTLDTVYNYIPKYEKEQVRQSHAERYEDDIWAEDIRKTQER